MGTVELTRARDRLLAADAAELHSTPLCEELVRAFHDVAGFEWCAVMTTDPTTMLPSTGVVEGFSSSTCAPFWENELVDPDFVKFADLARSHDPVGTLHEAVDGELDRSPRYQKLYAPLDPADELRVAFTAGTACLAVGVFLRPGPLGPFTDAEMADVRALVPVAVRSLRRAQGRGHSAVAVHPPAVVIVGGDGNVVSITEGAGPLLDDLRIQIDGELPGTLQIAAAKARWSRAASTLTTRLRGSSGQWLRVHVAPMAGEVGTVALTISPASPQDLAVILLDSYGLTERETEIVLRLCRGMATKEIAAELLISAHTVRDHIKAIFEKAGVTSRGELVAGLFTAHVLDDFHESVAHVAELD